MDRAAVAPSEGTADYQDLAGRASNWSSATRSTLPRTCCRPHLRNRLLRLAAFQNPEFYKAQAMRLPTYDKPRIIACAEDHPHHIGLPRGCLDESASSCPSLKIKQSFAMSAILDAPLDVEFHGELRPEQQAAADGDAGARHRRLAATTAFGKTVIAAWLIAQRGVNTLVLVHRRQLLDQWVERLSAFLGLAGEGDRPNWRRAKENRPGMLDVALMQSLVRKGVVDDRVGDYGHLIVDECHHLSAHSFEQVARRAKARFVTGLSATVTRKDGHHPIIFMQCGPVRHRVDAKQQAAARPFEHIVLVRPTGVSSAATGSPDPTSESSFSSLRGAGRRRSAQSAASATTSFERYARAARRSC